MAKKNPINFSLRPFWGNALDDVKVSSTGHAKVLCIYGTVHVSEFSFRISVFFPMKLFVFLLGREKYKSERCGKEIQSLQESGN